MQSLPEQDLVELTYACRVLSMEGHSDMTLGHLSLRDPEGRGLWLKRSGISLGEVRGPKDFVLIDFDGNKLAGEGRVHKEWPIHTEIMRTRQDVLVVGHSHPFHATVFSAMDLPLQPITHDAVYLGAPPNRYEGTTGLIDTLPLGRDHATALGDRSTVILRNHGVSYVGPSIAEAGLMGIFIERACKAQLLAHSTGAKFTFTPPAELPAKRAQIFDPGLIENFWGYYKRRLDG